MGNKVSNIKLKIVTTSMFPDMYLIQFSCKLSPGVQVDDITFPYKSKVHQIYTVDRNIVQLEPTQKTVGTPINVRSKIVAIDT